MNIPKWEKALWADNLTPEKVRNMSEVEIRSMLKQAMSRIKSMPDSIPGKKQMMELGKIALKMNEYELQIEGGVSDEEKEIIRSEILKLHNRAVDLLAKVISMQKNPSSFIERIVEIQEEIYEDPWGDSPDSSKEQEPEPEDINIINQEFDPWKTNEF